MVSERPRLTVLALFVSLRGMLVGRAREQAAIGRLLADAGAGRSGVLVLRGEAGIGKTVLLRDAAGRAEGMRVLRTTGVASEAELPFAGLHLLLGEVTGRIGRLPGGQAGALRGALGLAPAERAEPFMVGVALLTLLSDLAEEAPLLVLADDAHWLDQASLRALVFAARRLEAEGVAMLLAARTGEGDAQGVLAGGGLPELAVSGLGEQAAGVLLAEQAGELAALVRARVIAEAEGNPLALLELPKGLSGGQRLGVMAPLPLAVTATPAPSRVQAAFADRLQQLPASTRTLLLVAAAEDTGDVGVVTEAAQRLGSCLQDAEPAERCGLVDLTAASLGFRHPLAQAAAYHSAPLSQRMAAHRALAAVLVGPEQADRRAWHLAAATVEEDETVAVALEQAANRARDRGGTAAAAAALERAAQLTGDPRAKVARLVGAAEAALEAGEPDRAVGLADLAADFAADWQTQARIAAIRANVAYYCRQSPRAAARILLDGATLITEHAHATAARMLAVAAVDAWFGGDRVTADRAMAALKALPPSGQDGATGLAATARALQRLLADDFAGGLPPLRDLVARAAEVTEQPLMWIAQPAFIALWIGDEQAARDLAEAHVAACRARGMIGALPRWLLYLATAQFLAGRHADAHANAAEGLRLSQETGHLLELGFRGGVLARLAAIGGDRVRCEALAKDVMAESAGKGLVSFLAFSASALNLLDLGLGRYEAALERLEVVPRGTLGDAAMLAFGVSDLVEAAVRAGQPQQAKALLERYQAWAAHCGQTWAAAVAHRCQALVHPDQDAQQHYLTALQLHADGRRPFEHARTRLAYSQWLRRNRQRTHARSQLRAAWQTFDHLRAAPWAKQALAELRAAGETAQPPVARPDALGTLTPQELQVVRLAATGASNRDIAAQLFLSPRTVGYHLYKAFPKLGITSRHELARLSLDHQEEDGDQRGGA